MKKAVILLFAIVVVYGCNQGPKHPQADIINKKDPEPLTAESIIHIADSIDMNYMQLEKQHSLVYERNHENSYLERFSTNGQPQLYIEYIRNEGVSSIVRKYYLVDSNLVLIRENREITKSDGNVFDETRTYLRNNVSFKQDNRIGHSISELRSLSFLDTKQYKESKLTEDFGEKISSLDKMITGTETYEMVFDHFISAPDASYIILKSQLPSDRSASIMVQDKSALTDSLTNYPALFKDKKLNLTWKIEDGEAVYVPVADNVTSANGLKR